MDACDIRQYFIRQNVFCTISPNITLANISSYTVVHFSEKCPLMLLTSNSIKHKTKLGQLKNYQITYQLLYQPPKFHTLRYGHKVVDTSK